MSKVCISRVCWLALWSVAVGVPQSGWAQIVTDGSVGDAVDLGAGEVTIAAGLGQIRGANLLHSFEQFDIASGGSATFTGPAGLDHVIARVTGGEASLLNGLLRSTVPDADVILANPAGLIFGPDVVVDVPKAFHATTADAIGFADGSALLTGEGGAATLSIAAPASFGFLTDTPGQISNFGGTFGTRPGERLSLIGGDMLFQGNSAEAPSFVGSVSGELRLAAVAGQALVDLVDGSVEGPGGAVVIANNTILTVAGDSSGLLGIDAGTVIIAGNAALSAGGNSAAPLAGGIVIDADRLEVNTDASITLSNQGAGVDAGRLEIAAGALELETGGRISTLVSGDGAAAAIDIAADSFVIRSGGSVSATSFGAGRGGLISISSAELTIDGNGLGALTGISSDAFGGQAGGAAGQVMIVAETIDVRDDGQITAQNSGFGDPGLIKIQADRLSLDGSGGSGLTTVNVDGISIDGVSAGDAGTLDVQAGLLEIVSGSTLGAVAIGDGAAGTITIAGQTVRLLNDDPDRPTQISSESSIGGTNAPGSISLDVESLEMDGFVTIATSSFGTSVAGNIEIVADQISLNGRGLGSNSGIFSIGVAEGSAGAGQILVTARDSLLVDHGAGITTDSAGFGTGGDVQITGGDIVIRDGSRISASSFADVGGASGNVGITGRTIEVNNAFITTFGVQAAGGRIGLVGAERIELVGGTILSTGIVPVENSSIITLVAPQLILNASRVFSTFETNDVTPQTVANAGRAALLGEVTIVSDDSQILVTNDLEVTGLEAELGNDLAIDAAALVDVGRLLAAACTASRPETASSFLASPASTPVRAPDATLGYPNLDAAPDAGLATTRYVAAAC